MYRYQSFVSYICLSFSFSLLFLANILNTLGARMYQKSGDFKHAANVYKYKRNTVLKLLQHYHK